MHASPRATCNRREIATHACGCGCNTPCEQLRLVPVSPLTLPPAATTMPVVSLQHRWTLLTLTDTSSSNIKYRCYHNIKVSPSTQGARLSHATATTSATAWLHASCMGAAGAAARGSNRHSRWGVGERQGSGAAAAACQTRASSAILRVYSLRLPGSPSLSVLCIRSHPCAPFIHALSELHQAPSCNYCNQAPRVALTAGRAETHCIMGIYAGL